jgi:hypothetical protein
VNWDKVESVRKESRTGTQWKVTEGMDDGFFFILVGFICLYMDFGFGMRRR